MQKKIIALAVAGLVAAPAFAQSSVTISGWMSAGYENYKRSQGNGAAALAATQAAENRLSDGRYSRIRFSGTEDLGGGLKAIFQVESRFTADTGSDNIPVVNNFASGDNFVGLQSNTLGKVRLGRMDMYYGDGIVTEFNNAAPFQAFASVSILSQVNGSGFVRTGRYDNQIRYDSPNWNGFSAAAAYSFNHAGEEAPGANRGGKGGTWYVNANYMKGPIMLGASHLRQKREGGDEFYNLAGFLATYGAYLGQTAYPSTMTGAMVNQLRSYIDATAYRLWGAYTFPFGLKVGLMYDNTKGGFVPGASAKRAAWALPISYQTGPHKVSFTYAQAGNTKGNTFVVGGTTPNSKAKFYSVGYEYSFSRRTHGGVYYSQVRNQSGASYDLFGAGQALGLSGVEGTANGNTARSLYLGVNHYF